MEVVVAVAAELEGNDRWREVGGERDGKEVVEGDGGCGGGDGGDVLLGGGAGAGGWGEDEDGDGD